MHDLLIRNFIILLLIILGANIFWDRSIVFAASDIEPIYGEPVADRFIFFLFVAVTVIALLGYYLFKNTIPDFSHVKRPYRAAKRYLSSMTGRSGQEDGSIFLAIFGAVAMVAILGTSVMTFMKGPLATSVKLTKMNAAENQMSIGAQVAVMATASQPNNGDCDGDGFVEPMPWRTATTEPKPTGGGLVPLSLGISKKDPWGTEYGYCAWNHGPSSGARDCDTSRSAPATMLAGTNSRSYSAVSLISAGPDKTFTTTCRSFAAADVNADGDLLDATDLQLVSKAVDTDDDIITTFTYQEATGASGGLWNIKAGDPATAEINKKIEANAIKTAGLANLQGGVLLPDKSLITCDSTNAGVMARSPGNKGIEICDGSAWKLLTGEGACDAVPEFFAFTNQTNLTPSQQVLSNIAPLDGVAADCDQTINISAVNGLPEYRICSDASCAAVDVNWRSAASTFKPFGKFLQLRMTTSAQGQVTLTASLFVGVTRSDWSITTQLDCEVGPPGTVCPDGSVYAGLTPDGNVRMYTTPCDAGMAMSPLGVCLGSRTQAILSLGATFQAPSLSATAGAANTNLLLSVNDAGVPYAAAALCRSLATNGRNDWYLPAYNEVQILYNNRAAIKNFDSTLHYPSSTPWGGVPSSAGWQALNFNTGAVVARGNNSPLQVRCVRTNKNPSTAPANPGPFSFTNVTNANRSTSFTSNTVTLPVFAGPLTATCQNCTNIARNGQWMGTTTVGGFYGGDTIALRTTSPTQWYQTTSTTVTIGTTSSTWTVATPAPPNPCMPNMQPGQTCPNGTVVAGVTPDGGFAMYTTPCEAGRVFTAGNCTGTASTYNFGPSTITGISNTTTGLANTNALVALGSGTFPAASTYPQARYCFDLVTLENDDWYLPSLNEAAEFSRYNIEIGGWSQNGYGTSWDQGNSNSASWQIYLNTYYNSDKVWGFPGVRCVRTDRGTPQTKPTAPNTVTFPNVSNATTGTTITSNTVALSLFTGRLTANCPQCTAIARNGFWTNGTSLAGFGAGDTIALQVTAPAWYSSVTANLTIATMTATPWVVSGPAPSSPCTPGAVPGTVCPDGTVLAGLSPDGNVPMYTTRCDAGQTLTAQGGCTGIKSLIAWGPNGLVLNGITNANQGAANTNALIAAGSFPAASYCKGLSAAGYSDWYLPANNELAQLNIYRNQISAFLSTGNSQRYLSSTEWSPTDNIWANTVFFDRAFALSNDYRGNLNVARCVRK